MIKGDDDRTSKMASQFALLKPPSFNGKPGALFAIWDMKFRAGSVDGPVQGKDAS